ncbi:MAG: NAD(P)/FAD-dependent oxidoreductase [Candidatus Dormibacteraeota bacterium]|nr:NAD(P)/FAD-dependent oxidoreductase [Candidatus Dormibacteraeota bacterium]
MDADVAVIGGGLVGASFGLLVRRAGLSAMVLDQGTFPRDKPCGEGLMPAGAAVLAGLGLDLEGHGFPALAGVRYRLGEGGRDGTAGASFRNGHGFGVRRVRLDTLLAERAGVVEGVTVTALEAAANGVRLETSQGAVRARVAVGTDGLRSQVRAWSGWERAPRQPHRHGLVGHLRVERPVPAEVQVTVLDTVEVYTAPCGPGEMLAAVLGPRGTLRRPGVGVEASYRETLARAYPDLGPFQLSDRLWGAGPFSVAPECVAEGRVFLAGDAAGFCDPLTGDGMSAGLRQAEALARFLAADMSTAAARYRRWHATQWRRRRIVGRLALTLTGSGALARRALAGMRRRPAALQTLLAVNDGSRGLSALGMRDWAALAGL